jgi:DNA-binding HxlR family transcriptional regulator
VDDKINALKSRVQPGDREVLPSVIERILDKWSLFTLILLARQPRRFTDLLESIPDISRRMLTVTLRKLERDGLIERIAHSDAPPRIEYAVTDLGHTVNKPVAAVFEWALDHREEVLANRERYDASQKS